MEIEKALDSLHRALHAVHGYGSWKGRASMTIQVYPVDSAGHIPEMNTERQSLEMVL